MQPSGHGDDLIERCKKLGIQYRTLKEVNDDSQAAASSGHASSAPGAPSGIDAVASLSPAEEPASVAGASPAPHASLSPAEPASVATAPPAPHASSSPAEPASVATAPSATHASSSPAEQRNKLQKTAAKQVATTQDPTAKQDATTAGVWLDSCVSECDETLEDRVILLERSFSSLGGMVGNLGIARAWVFLIGGW